MAVVAFHEGSGLRVVSNHLKPTCPVPSANPAIPLRVANEGNADSCSNCNLRGVHHRRIDRIQMNVSARGPSESFAAKTKN